MISTLPTRRTWRRLAAGALAALGVGTLLATSAAPAQAASPYRKPVANGLANPGAIQVGSQWVVHSTGSWDAHHVGVADHAGGPYTVTTQALLTNRAGWMSSSDHSVWAPSVVQATTGAYVAFYAAPVAGFGGARCIGTAVGSSAAGPFTPTDRAIACFARSGARPYDKLASEGNGFSLIDPTPAWVGGGLVLTYKTQFRTGGRWHTTTRMLQLDPANPTVPIANPVHADGSSVQLTDSLNKYIEENPVLVEHSPGVYTLFTSFGWFGTCRYATRYRQTTDLWGGFPAVAPRSLAFKHRTHTCGTGNAQVSLDATNGKWVIFFNGHTDRATKGGPKGLYVGRLKWTQTGRPIVTRLR